VAQKDFSVLLSPRSTLSGAALTPAVQLLPRWYSWHVRGGPKQAELIARGDPVALRQLASMVGYVATIYNPVGQPVWWGLIDDPELSSGKGELILPAIGFYQTLDDYYCPTPGGMHSYIESGGERQNFGEGSNINAVGENIVLPAGSNYNTIGIFLYKANVPIDDVLIEIRDTNAAGTLLASATILNATVPAGGGYIEVALSAGVTPGNRYIVVSRTGSNNSTHFWQVGISTTAGYADGFLSVKVNTTWQVGAIINGSTGVAADLLFKLSGKVVTTTQVSNLVTAKSQYITAVDLVAVSTATKVPDYTDDDRVLKMVEELLDIGQGGAGGKRLLATVTQDRRLIIDAEPLPTAGNLYLFKGGMRYGFKRSKMANYVAVAYTTTDGTANTSGKRGTTGWASDTDSISEFKRKELKISQSNMDATTAAALRDVALDQLKTPPVWIALDSSTKLEIESPHGSPVRRDECLVGFWAKLVDTGIAAPDDAQLYNASLVFIEEAEYDCETDTYKPTPRNVASAYEFGKYQQG